MAQVQPFSVPQPSVGKYKKSQVNIIGKRGSPRDAANPSFFYSPIQLVAPSAVTIAVAILAIICKINFMVSFLLIIFNV